MAHKPIDRTNHADLLKQIGRTEEKISQLNRKNAKFDREINGWDDRKEHLENLKSINKEKISKHRKYINELEEDLKTLQQ